MTFHIDPQLERDSIWVCDLSLCQVRLRNDSRWPWLILVPKRPEVVDITDLSEADGAQLMAEIRSSHHAVMAWRHPLKTNIAWLGNVVRQLHIHVIGRREGDTGWPGPVWGIANPVPYTNTAIDTHVTCLRDWLIG